MPTLHSELTVKTQKHGDIILRVLTLGDMSFINKIEDLPPREFTIQILQHQMVDPAWDVETVKALSDTTLEEIAKAWLANSYPETPVRDEIFTQYKSILIASIVNSRQELTRISRQIIKSQSETLQLAFQNWPSHTYVSPGLVVPPALHQAISGITAINDIAQMVSEISTFDLQPFRDAALAASRAVTAGTRVIDSLPVINPALITMWQSSQHWIEQSQQSIQNIGAFLTQGSVIAQQLSPVVGSVFDLLKTVGNYYETVAGTDLDAMTSSTVYQQIVIPTRSTATLVHSIEAFGNPQNIKLGEVAQNPGYKVNSEALRSLETLDTRFAHYLQGAWQTLSSGNLDAARQAAHSARELIRQVLDHLAPDNVFSASDIKQRGKDGKVIRKMRIGYILNKKQSSNLVKVIDKTIDTVDEMYQSLSAIAHAEEEDETTIKYVKGMIIALEGMIVILIH